MTTNDEVRRADPSRLPLRDPSVPGWIHWPIRVVAILVVVPVRLLWEVLTAAGSALVRYVVEPVGRAAGFVVDVVFVRPAAWLWRYLIVVPVTFLVHHLIVVPLRWLWGTRHAVGGFLSRYVLGPLAWLAGRLVVVPVTWLGRHLLLLPLRWLGHHLVVVPVRWLWARRQGAGAFLRRFVVHPVGWLLRTLVWLPTVWAGRGLALLWRGLVLMVRYGLVVPVLWVAGVLTPAWYAAGRLLRLLGTLTYRWLLRPFGLAAAWLWTHTVVLLWRATVVVWRTAVVAPARWIRDAVLAPTRRWLRDTVLTPTADACRSVLTAVGLRRE